MYGGTSGTEAEQAYYRAFGKKYEGVARWHDDLQNEAIRTHKVRLPSGREYAFPYARRNQYGGATGATQIKNYPVQGFATADIVPCTVILVYNELKARGLRSLLINTVHDSICLDVYPGEEESAKVLLHECMMRAETEVKRRYDYEISIPLACEIKIGTNWLDGKVVE